MVAASGGLLDSVSSQFGAVLVAIIAACGSVGVSLVTWRSNTGNSRSARELAWNARVDAEIERLDRELDELQSRHSELIDRNLRLREDNAILRLGLRNQGIDPDDLLGRQPT